MRILPKLIQSSFLILSVFLLSFGSIAGQGADACGVCHRELHDEWLQSRHSQAWKSESFQAQLQAFGSSEFCGRCHAPQSVWQQVELELKENVKLGGNRRPDTKDFQEVLAKELTARSENLEDGVSCASCHYVEVLWPGGSADEVLGPYHSEVSHTGKSSTAFQSFQLCRSCHGRDPNIYLPPQGAGSGYHHSRNFPIEFASENDCGSCHMPPREETLVQLRVFKDLPKRRVGEHTFSGRRYAALAEALEFSLDEGSLRIRNQGIGHAPKISNDTSYLLRIHSGDQVQEVTLDDPTQLQPGESLSIPLEVSQTPLTVEFFRIGENAFKEALFSRTVE